MMLRNTQRKNLRDATFFREWCFTKPAEEDDLSGWMR